MKNVIFRILSVMMLLCATACTSYQNHAPHAPEADALIWQISKTGQPTSYLIGTIHLNEKNRPLPDNFVQALKKSQRLVVESHEDAYTLTDIMLIFKDIQDPQRRPLSQTLGTERINKIKNIFENSAVSSHIMWLKPDNTTSPVFAFFMLNYAFTPANVDAEHGIDNLLKQQAQTQKTPIVGLDDAAAMGIILRAIPEDVAIRGIDALIQNQDVARQETQDLLNFYNQTQVQKIWQQDEHHLRHSPTIPDQDRAFTRHLYNEIMLKQRNQKWLPQLTQILPEKSHTVAVGSAHLFGEYGLIRLLRDEGYTITPILPTQKLPEN